MPLKFKYLYICKARSKASSKASSKADLITSDYRPVPLKFKYLDRKGICELFDKEPNKKGQVRLN